MCIRNEYLGASSQKYALHATCERKYKQNDKRNQAKFGIVRSVKKHKKGTFVMFLPGVPLTFAVKNFPVRKPKRNSHTFYCLLQHYIYAQTI